MEWKTVSKAAEMSRRTRMVTRALSVAIRRSFGDFDEGSFRCDGGLRVNVTERESLQSPV